MRNHYCIILFSFIVLLFRSSHATYNVVTYGAHPDGKTDSTLAFKRAWGLACGSKVPATLYVPRGSFLIKAVVFNGPCKSKVRFKNDGGLVAPTDYRLLGDSGYWILFSKVSMLDVNGGSFDARGAGFWACRKSGKSCPAGARSISFRWSHNVMISGLKSINSQIMHITIDHCNNVMVHNVSIKAPSGSPNTDGIHIQSSADVTIMDTVIMTGDDCVSMGMGTTNVLIERIACGPGHGISIGSLGENLYEDGVENVTVTSSTLSRTQNGVRIKSWGRPSNGFATNIVFQNIIMQNVDNPIIVDQNYCPDNKGCPRQSSGVQISKVTYKNIKGISGTPIAVNFDCSSSKPCKGIRLQDINLTYYTETATGYCNHAHGSSSGKVVPKSCLEK